MRVALAAIADVTEFNESRLKPLPQEMGYPRQRSTGNDRCYENSVSRYDG